MEQLIDCRYETTTKRIKRLLDAASDERVNDIDDEHVKNTGPLLKKVRQDEKTQQSLAYISSTFEKYIGGAREMTAETSIFQLFRQQFGSPSVRRFLTDETLNIVKALRPSLQEMA